MNRTAWLIIALLSAAAAQLYWLQRRRVFTPPVNHSSNGSQSSAEDTTDTATTTNVCSVERLQMQTTPIGQSTHKRNSVDSRVYLSNVAGLVGEDDEDEEDDEQTTTTSLTFYNSGLVVDDFISAPPLSRWSVTNRCCSPIIEESEDSVDLSSSSSSVIYGQLNADDTQPNNDDDDRYLVDFDDDPDFQQLILQESQSKTIAQLALDSDERKMATLQSYADSVSKSVLRQAVDTSCGHTTTANGHSSAAIDHKWTFRLKIKKRRVKCGRRRCNRVKRKSKRSSCYAYVTTINSEQEEVNAVHLGHSLKLLSNRKRNGRRAVDTCALIAHQLDTTLRQLLRDVFTHVYSTRDLCSHDDLALSLLGRPEVAANCAKIQCWRLTQYKKCVFLQADTLVLSNCDDLFEREELSAVPDVGWPDCFNAGVFVFRPSLHTYAQLVSLLNSTTKYNYQGGDQGLLNTYFGDWRNDLTKRLPFVYNVVPSTHYTYAPALQRFSSAIKIVHFYKPWSMPWPTDYSGPNDHMSSWATIFKNKVLPKLPQAAQQLVDASRSGTAEQLFQRLDQPPVEQQSQSSAPALSHHQSEETYQPAFHYQNTQSAPFTPEPKRDEPPESTHVEPPAHIPAPIQTPDHPPTPTQYHDYQPGPKDNREEEHRPPVEWHAPVFEYEPNPLMEANRPMEEQAAFDSSSAAEPLDPHWEALLWDNIKSPWEPPPPVQIQDYQPSVHEEEQPPEPVPLTFGWYSSDTGAQPPSSPSDQPHPDNVPQEDTPPAPPPPPLPPAHESSTHSIEEDLEDDEREAGPETSEKSVERMKAWEEGNIDYLGQDRFDNIWRRLELMLKDPDDEEEDEEEVDEEVELKSEEMSEREEGDAVVPDVDEEEGKAVVDNWLGYPEGEYSGMYEWQEGRIDYTGRDKSDNIMKRLNLVISGVVPYIYN